MQNCGVALGAQCAAVHVSLRRSRLFEPGRLVHLAGRPLAGAGLVYRVVALATALKQPKTYSCFEQRHLAGVHATGNRQGHAARYKTRAPLPPNPADRQRGALGELRKVRDAFGRTSCQPGHSPHFLTSF